VPSLSPETERLLNKKFKLINLFVYVSAHQPPLRHHSGHFRHKMALLWDPHPQYEFSAFGRYFHLLLAHDSSFVLPDLQVSIQL
jgi:hypothetical protein